MRPKVREILDTLDAFFTTEDLKDTKPLWDILSALRGPDNSDEEVKDSTTIPIRCAAFPKLAWMEQERYRLMLGDYRTGAVFHSMRGANIKYQGPEGYDHFQNHVQRAWTALQP
jgi:hypothetical protein